MLKIVKALIYFIFKDSLMTRKFKKIISNIINAFTVTFDQFNASLLN